MPEEGTIVQELPWYAKCSLDDVRCFIGANLKTVARCVVAVGYYLKQVRDRELWKDAEDAGYLSVWDFASREFGISKSTASRYMSINDRFSEGGDSPLILEKYAELSKSQLQEMLYLTDQQAEAVTQETTVQQIRAMRIPEPRPVEVLEGQMSFEDFGIEPMEAAAHVSGMCPVTVQENTEPVAIPLEEFMPLPETEDDIPVATSQQTEEDEEPEDYDEEDIYILAPEYQEVIALLDRKRELFFRNLAIFHAQSYDDLDDETWPMFRADALIITALECYAEKLKEKKGIYG